MTQPIVVEIGVIFLLVLANGVFAMSEIAVVSSRKTRLSQMARAGSRRAAAALRLAENPDRFLSTIQIGITLIGVFAGAFGGATIARQIDDYLETIPALYSYSEAIGIGVVVLGITYLSLILGELVPKRLALNAPERVAAFVAPAMHFLSRLGAPAVHVLGASTRLVLRILRVQPAAESPITPEELRVMLHQGVAAGTIGKEERAILDRALRLAARRVRAVMTPRVEIEWLDASLPLSELRARAARSAHHRFPLAAGRIDEIRGIVTLKDIYRPDVDSTMALERHIQQPLFVPETATALSLLQEFRETRNHLAVVVDEFGGVEGIVTPTDILEALVGELPEAGEAYEPAIVLREDGSWSVDAAVDLEELESVTGIPVLPEQKEEFQTVGGYLIGRAGGLPRLGDVIRVGDYQFEIIDVDGRRLDRIIVSRLPGI
ncbi:MAG TPA: hemolysin family protein, partial [Thermoanaerobaculia bacterium]|nr:hemolysin family protein [Thermoanaerobaculia bacterium]